jgi:hypothetical protein
MRDLGGLSLAETDPLVCPACGVAHPEEEIELTFQRPDAIAAMTVEARAARCRETDEQCAIWGAGGAGHRFFVHALLPLAVENREQPYCLGIWLEVSDETFYRIDALADDPGQSTEPPMAATLANNVPFHAQSAGLLGSLRLTGRASSPSFLLAESEHGLYLEQQAGISPHRAWEYTRLVA